MLVPLVLRNIVLPYLRAGTSAAGAPGVTATVVVARRRSRRITTSATQARAEATLLAERDEIRWEPFARTSLSPIPPPQLEHAARAQRKPPNPRPDEADVAEALQKPTGTGEEKRGGRREGDDKPPTQPKPKLRVPPRPKPTPSVDLSRGDFSRRCVPLPVTLRKLLDAKLFRAAVFALLESPEWMADEALVHAVAERLDDKGASTLAHRLRRTLEMGLVTGAGGRVRLWSDPKPKTLASGGSRHAAPPSNRVPLVPRPAYPEATAQGRRTHHWNLLLTQWLTVRHPIPYVSPFERTRPNGHTAAPARLRRLRDVLHTIDSLRTTRGFVPDRVTANIVLKAYLSCLARGTRGEGRDAHPLPFRAGLRSDDLREVFRLIAASIEDGVAKGLVTGEGDDEVDAARSKGTSKGKSKGKSGKEDAMDAQREPLDFGFDKFDAHVSYESHVQPFTRMMARAMVRVGDHRGRIAIEKWGEVMRARIHKLQGREDKRGKEMGEAGKKASKGV